MLEEKAKASAIVSPWSRGVEPITHRVTAFILFEQMTKLFNVPVIKVASNFVIFGSNPSGFLHSFVYVENGISRFFGKQAGAGKAKISVAGRKEAQAALRDYLHWTRGLRFADAQYMSLNAKFFLKHLLDKVEINEQEVGKSVARFLRYHPINEFEPFFESLGLRPSRDSALLPRNLTFLSDDQHLLDNYYALCDFGIPRNTIGKMYENARGLFQLDPKTLTLMLQSSSKLGFSRPFLSLVFSRTPQIGSNNSFKDLTQVMSIFGSCGREIVWIEEHLKECSVFNWSTVLRVLQFFMMNGYTYQQLGNIMEEHPDILFHNCGHTTLCLVSFLSKFGSNPSQIPSTLLQITNVELFHGNLRRFYHLFRKIVTDGDSIGHLFRSHVQTLGCCVIKAPRTLMKQLRIGRKRLKKMIMEDPERLWKWAFGNELKPHNTVAEKTAERLRRMKFLSSIGCDENSPETRKLLKRFQSESCDLHERFEFLVSAGVSREDACSMIKRYPQIICQNVDVLQNKLSFFVEELKYPLSEWRRLSSCLCYAPERVKLRLSMYELHKIFSRKRETSIVTVMSCSDKEFVQRYVRKHPNGMAVWEQLRNKFYGK